MRARHTIPMLLLVLGACHATAAGRAIAPSPGPIMPRVVAATAREALHSAIDSIVDAPAFQNANWGILVVDTAGDTLYSRNAGKLFMPASNMKLLTTSVALTQLGPEFRYRTAFVGRGDIVDGTLRGDLLVVGRGDPSVSDHMQQDALRPLRSAAESLYARGIRRIEGQLVAAGNAFPDPVLGFGWSWDDLEAAYSAPTDELLFNEGFSTIVVYGGARPGDSVRAVTHPARTFPTVRVTATTVDRVGATDSARGQRRPSIVVRKDTTTGAVLIGGTILVGDSVVETVTHRDPDAAYLAALGEALRDRGIVVDGQPGQSIGSRSDTLATLDSPPLREILPALLKPSQNQMAEMLFKTIGLERGTAGSVAESRRIVEAQLLAWGAIDGGFVIRDGSGLSRYDYVSPATIIHILDAMRRSPSFGLFYDALPIAGVDGTLKTRMRGTPAEGKVHAKTGSVSQARSLSGYVQTVDGRRLMFSLLANNWTVPARDVERAQDSIAVRLATMRPR